MTREEQKQIADFVRSYIHEIITESGADKNAHTNEVLRKVAEGIEALFAEPCEDMISRDLVFDELDKLQDGLHRDAVVHVDCIADMIANLPSVTPKQKTGRWIEVIDEIDGLGNKTWHHKCSICGNEDSGWGEYKYCPKCGAKMAESEDKE